jgi:emp24/gp25L/p24 family/GOLD
MPNADERPTKPQITDPNNAYTIHQQAVSSGDHSFTAQADGKYVYCFSNEHWSATSKEVSFNVHGIVYVPESDAPSDPLEAEGSSQYKKIPSPTHAQNHKSLIYICTVTSPPTLRAPHPSQRRAILYYPPRANAQKHSREHKRESEMVEHLSARCTDRRGDLPGLVAKAIFRGALKDNVAFRAHPTDIFPTRPG